MSSYQKNLRSYARAPEPGSPRRTESWALLEAARRMSDACRGGDEELLSPEVKEERKSALRLNWRLWTIFQAELTGERPEMPADLRINMLTLCAFVDKHTIGALVEPTSQKLKVLIDINRNIALGLLEDAPAEAGSAADTQPHAETQIQA